MRPDAIIKFSFITSVPIYVAVAWLTAQNAPPIDENGMPPDQFRIFFLALVAVYFASVLIAPLVANSIVRQRGGYTKEAMLVKLAFYESGAIYGLLLSFISHDLSYVAGFGTVAVFLMLLLAPVPVD